ncbi:MAG: hypothetical protein ABI395_12885 [Sphingobium sp.]
MSDIDLRYIGAGLARYVSTSVRWPRAPRIAEASASLQSALAARACAALGPGLIARAFVERRNRMAVLGRFHIVVFHSALWERRRAQHFRLGLIRAFVALTPASVLLVGGSFELRSDPVGARHVHRRHFAVVGRQQ